MTYYHLTSQEAQPQLIDNPVIIKQLQGKAFQVGDQIMVGDLITIPLEVVHISDESIIFKWTK